MKTGLLIAAVSMFGSSMAFGHGAAPINFAERLTFLEKTSNEIVISAPVTDPDKLLKFRGLTITPVSPGGVAGTSFAPSPLAPNGLPTGGSSVDITSEDPLTAIGFDLFDPTTFSMCDVLTGCEDSVFTAEIFSGDTSLGEFSFTPTSDGLSFFGVTSETPFDKVTVTETSGGSGDEVFSNIVVAPSVVPLPASLPLLAASLGAIFVMRRRRRA